MLITLIDPAPRPLASNCMASLMTHTKDDDVEMKGEYISPPAHRLAAFLTMLSPLLDLRSRWSRSSSQSSIVHCGGGRSGMLLCTNFFARKPSLQLIP